MMCLRACKARGKDIRDLTYTLIIHSSPCSYQHLLLLQELRKLAILMHRNEDVTTANKLLVHIQLWYRRPFRVLFDSYTMSDNTIEPASLIEYQPCLRASSSKTLNAENLAGSTPCSPRICMLARENPHCGVSGVPFMNNTTGVDATALSIAARVSSLRKRAAWKFARRRGV